MEFKRPETFEDILKLQKHLDKNLNNVRPRTLRDIVLSLIAEYIEFNEETPESHKTWKTKPYDKQKELEELTDMYFFLAQMVNFGIEHSKSYGVVKYEIINSFNEKFEYSYYSKILNNLFLPAYNCDSLSIAKEIFKITGSYGYTKDDILNCYWEKWQKNMQRIGKEWN